MPSNGKSARACPKCYLGAGLSDRCSKCGGETQSVYFGTKITVPKKNDRRAWKRIFNGEKFWNRRKVKRAAMGNRSDTVSIYDYERVPADPPDCDCACCIPHSLFRMRRVPGSERKITNMRRKPDVDLGE